MIIRTTKRYAKFKAKDGTTCVDPRLLVTTVYLLWFIPVARFESLAP